MCDSCGAKISRISRKHCHECRQYFCPSCAAQAGGASPFQCRKCRVFSSPLMERAHLEQLNLHELKFFLNLKKIDVPLNASKGDLMNFILGRQARTMIEMAERAIKQVHGQDGVDLEQVDIRRLEPYSSAYSISQTKPDVTVATTTLSASTGAQIRAEVKRKSDLTKTKQKSDLTKVFDPSKVTDLGDIQHESQLHELSVRQLKIILQKNCINYKGCVEKQELLERVVRLWHSREEEKDLEAKIAETEDHNAENEFMCKVCMDAPVDCVLLECGHMFTCVTCGRKLAECPICRHYVTRVVHAFRV